MRNLVLLALIITALVIPTSHGLAASYGEGKVIVRAEVPEGQTIEIDRSIRVKNVNNITIKVTLEPTENFKKIITLIDKEVLLKPGEMQRAKFKIVLKSGGTYEGKILLKFSPVDTTVKTNSAGGSSSMTIIADGPVNEYFYEVMGNKTTLSSTDSDTSNLDNNSMDSNEEQQNVTKVSTSKGISITGGNTDSGISPFFGILISLGIVAIGMAIYFLVVRGK